MENTHAGAIGLSLFGAGDRGPQTVMESQVSHAGLLPNADNYLALDKGCGCLVEAPYLHRCMIRAGLQDEAMPERLARGV